MEYRPYSPSVRVTAAYPRHIHNRSTPFQHPTTYFNTPIVKLHACPKLVSARLIAHNSVGIAALTPQWQVKAFATTHATMSSSASPTFARSSEWSKVTLDIQKNLDFMFPSANNLHAAAGKKKRNRKHGKAKANTTTTPAHTDADDATAPGAVFTDYNTAVAYDKARVQHHLTNNPLLTALVQPIPGVMSKGDQVEITWSEDIIDFSKMSNALSNILGDDPEPAEEDMDLGDDAEADLGPDEEVDLFIEAGDIGKMLIMRDASYDEDDDDDL